jgi:hypothetical protein
LSEQKKVILKMGAGGMAQVVECLPSKHRPWIQILISPKQMNKSKKKKKRVNGTEHLS